MGRKNVKTGNKKAQDFFSLLSGTLPTFWAWQFSFWIIVLLNSCLILDFQMSRFPDAATGVSAGTTRQTLRSQPDPLPTHRRIKCVARSQEPSSRLIQGLSPFHQKQKQLLRSLTGIQLVGHQSVGWQSVSHKSVGHQSVSRRSYHFVPNCGEAVAKIRKFLR